MPYTLQPKRESDLYPAITVVMPIRNEAEFIARSLKAVYQQDYPSHRLEVIVVDGHSTDNTCDVVRRVASNYRVETTILENTGRTVPKGLNMALACARGEILLRVDGHTIIARDYVRQCVAALDRSGADNVGGRMRPVGRGCFGKAVAVATSSPFGIGGSRFHYSNREEFVDTVYMGAWRRTVFQRIGVFDEEQVRNQDDEFNYRVRSSGGTVLLSPCIRSRYFNRSTPRSLWRQYYQYGYWKVRVLQKHPRQMKVRHIVPLLLVLTFLAVMFAEFFWRPGGWFFILYVGTYLLANAVAALVTARRTSLRIAAMLPLTFAILHTSYGTGFLVGLVRFWNRPAEGAQELLAKARLHKHEELIRT